MKSQQILGASTLGALLILLAACGQQGALYLPTDPAAQQRATLPQTLLPGTAAGAASAPSHPASQPARP
jgi:predicted small lipoprotein YifL